MQRWEYLVIACVWDEGDWRPKYLNGRERKDWRTSSVYAYMDNLGEQGWELVNLATTDFTYTTGGTRDGLQVHHEQTYRLAFKRPKE